MSSSEWTHQDIMTAIFGLDSWFDSMRLPGGYGGPVAHWWDDCLIYQGPGLDWRYEGIILGYLNLWESTGDRYWLNKANRAGDDLVQGQLPSGNFNNSKCHWMASRIYSGLPRSSVNCLELPSSSKQFGETA
jgi:hypothetical protein